MARKVGQPKKFKTGEQVIELWTIFCKQIVENGYIIIPSQTNFCEWISENYGKVDRRTIYNTLNEYFPEVKKEFEEIRSDIIAQGAMLGKYKETMSIFALKNWCKWTDKVETSNFNTNKNVDLKSYSIDELKELIEDED